MSNLNLLQKFVNNIELKLKIKGSLNKLATEVIKCPEFTGEDD